MKKDYTHISIVLDSSSSMAGIAPETRSGVNTFIKSQGETPGDCTVTLVKFADLVEPVFRGKPVAEVGQLQPESYQPYGNTALYDGIADTVKWTGEWLAAKPEGERPAKVIFVIVTDGAENCSKRHTREQVFATIKEQQETYKWEFVFIGANQDALKAGAGIGISASHSVNYAANSVGTHALYRSVGSNVRSARASGQSMAWREEQRKEQDKAKGK